MMRIVCILFVLPLFVSIGAVARCGETTGDRFASPSDRVDQYLSASWQETATRPSPRSGDAEFCRRAWLDLAGVAPPVWQLRRFLADPSGDKRKQLIESLLSSSRFATHMAHRWNAFLLPAESSDDRQGDAAALHAWLRQQFLNNTPYDHLVGGFLTAGGKSDQGPAIFYTSRNLEPVKLAAATSRLFMGVQLECAQCHDHPFASWTQDDFWSFAAFFAQLQLSDSNLRGGGQAIEDRSGAEVTFPESERVMAPRYPGVTSPPEADPTDFRRRQLTIWLASRNNPYFARAAANRVWAHLFGRGLVDPVDAMDSSNPPSHPELLQYLADYLVEQRFDLRELYRMLTSTQAYHRTSAIVDGQRHPPDSFAAMNVKTLSASQYFDSLHQNVLLGRLNASADSPQVEQAVRDEFLRRMKAPDASPSDYPHGVVQVLGMMNGPEMLAATAEAQSGLIASMDAPFFSDTERIETLFLACLSRPPSDSELEMFLAHLNDASAEQPSAARLSDLTWILLNTAECFVCP
ncbi:hypothetical protein Enr13x_35220 [Stieleria neptunia]|uniref:DUF1553 domain-containing protein n=1 Tax=Stieleria neptunia TaxID=2527979 RepID=A0A518HS39_9BACT|nr:DUF1549 and DUF1553 domain-containing protein [Stieleria neptunia]QDV43665.1 hypothetical protein Enr13x_35220 [Stieleria neptunia]